MITLSANRQAGVEPGPGHAGWVDRGGCCNDHAEKHQSTTVNTGRSRLKM